MLDAFAPAAAAGGILLGAVGAWLLLARSRTLTNGSFAVALLAHGLALALAPYAGGGPGSPDAVAKAAIHLVYVAPFATLLFAISYREHLLGRPPPRFVAWALAPVAAIPHVLFLLDPSLQQSAATLQMGPLSLFAPGVVLAWGFAALLLGEAALRLPRGHRRASGLLIAVGLALLPTAVAAAMWTKLPTGGILLHVEMMRPDGAVSWEFVGERAYFLAIVPTLVLARLLAGQMREAHARRVFLAVVAAILLGVAVQGYESSVGGRLTPVALAVYALLAAQLALFTIYGVLRHQLFDADGKARGVVRIGTIASAFLAVGLLGRELAEPYLGARWAPYVGVLAAGAVLFVRWPLRRLADRIAALAVPSRPVRELPLAKRRVIYREQFDFAWADGSLTRAEKLRLDKLRERLGLSLDEAADVETEVTGA